MQNDIYGAKRARKSVLRKHFLQIYERWYPILNESLQLGLTERR